MILGRRAMAAGAGARGGADGADRQRRGGPVARCAAGGFLFELDDGATDSVAGTCYVQPMGQSFMGRMAIRSRRRTWARSRPTARSRRRWQLESLLLPRGDPLGGVVAGSTAACGAAVPGGGRPCESACSRRWRSWIG